MFRQEMSFVQCQAIRYLGTHNFEKQGDQLIKVSRTYPEHTGDPLLQI